VLSLGDVSSFKRVSRDEHCRHFVSALPCHWISKFRHRSAASSCTHADGDAHTSCDLDPDGDAHTSCDPYPDRDAHTSCHPAPAFWAAHFALTGLAITSTPGNEDMDRPSPSNWLVPLPQNI
jgi:hypothetical protein